MFSDQRIHIAMAASPEYLPHASVVATSVLATQVNQALSIHVVHMGDISAENKTKFLALSKVRKDVQINFIAVSAEALDGLPSLKFMAAQLWLRLLLPSLLKDIDRVLYLDCDTIVTDTLRPLWDLDMNGRLVAAVTAPLPLSHKSWPKELGLPEGHKYFGSGVLLFNLAEMRRRNTQEALLDYGRSHGERLLWRDQDALNAILGRSFLELHPRWNFMNSIAVQWEGRDGVFKKQELVEAMQMPAIVHYEGHPGGKPWRPRCPHPYWPLYFDYLSKSPWAGEFELPGRRAKLGYLRWRLLVRRQLFPVKDSSELKVVIRRHQA